MQKKWKWALFDSTGTLIDHYMTRRAALVACSGLRFGGWVARRFTPREAIVASEVR